LAATACTMLPTFTPLPWSSHMAKRNYRAWTPCEESNFQSWVARHPDLTWSERARKYSIERKPRSAESLRTKHRLLKKNIRRHHRPIRTEPSRLRPSSAMGKRPGQQKAGSSPIYIITPIPSEPSPQSQCSIMQVKARQTLISGSRYVRPPAQPPIQRGRAAACHGQAVRAPLERENASGDQIIPPPDVPGTDPLFPWHISRNTRHNNDLLGAGHRGRCWELSRPSGTPRKIDLLWRLVYHVAGRVRQ
jgi:hypothetical protein